MATRQTEFSISIEKLEIKFKGTQELGQQIQQGVTQAIGGLLNTQARLLAPAGQPPKPITGTVLDATETHSNGQGIPEENGDKPKQVRQRRAKGGPSTANLLLSSKQEGYFSQARSGGEAVTYLKDSKGHNLRSSAVMTELQRMIQKKDGDAAKLYRTKNESGDYIYKDTPFDEGQRSPSPADQPTE